MAMTVPNTIMKHLGGKAYLSRYLINDFKGSTDTLSFKLSSRSSFKTHGKISRVEINLISDDLYNIKFFHNKQKKPEIAPNVCGKELQKTFIVMTGLEELNKDFFDLF